MSLGAALRDRGRLLTRERIATRNSEGGYDYTSAPTDVPAGPWFRCLYDEGTVSENRDDGRIRKTRPATVMIGKRCLDGSALVLNSKDRIEVASRTGDTFVFEITGIKSILKGRVRLGYEATVQRVEP